MEDKALLFSEKKKASFIEKLQKLLDFGCSIHLKIGDDCPEQWLLFILWNLWGYGGFEGWGFFSVGSEF